MPKKNTFMGQFKSGYVPRQHVDEGSPLNQHEASPSAVKKRQGLALGTQLEARPGLVGKQDRPRTKRK